MSMNKSSLENKSNLDNAFEDNDSINLMSIDFRKPVTYDKRSACGCVFTPRIESKEMANIGENGKTKSINEK